MNIDVARRKQCTLGWFHFYVLATSTIISGQAPTYDSAHSWCRPTGKSGCRHKVCMPDSRHIHLYSYIYVCA